MDQGQQGAPAAAPGGPTYQQPYTAGQPYPATGTGTAASGANYSTLGGWLLFFVICWVLGGIYNIFTGITQWAQVNEAISFLNAFGGGGLSTLLTATFLFTIISGAANLLLAWLVFQRNPQFLRIYQIISIALIVIVLILSVILATTVGSYGAELGASVMGGLIGSMIGSIVGLILMTMYFCKSERVKVYMGGTEYQSRALFRIGV